MCHPEPNISQSLTLCNACLVCITVLPLGRQHITLHFTFDVQPQGRITRPRTPSSGNGHARHSAATVHEFVASLAHYLRSVLGTLQDRSAALIVVGQPIPFPPAANVSTRPVQAGLRQMGQYQRHNDILYADITLKGIPS